MAMIDHGFCFNDGDWTFPDNPIRGIYPRRLVYEKVSGMESFEPFLSRIENLTAGDLEECTQGIPTKWCEPDPDQLSRLIEALIRGVGRCAKRSSTLRTLRWPVSQLGVRRKESGVRSQNSGVRMRAFRLLSPDF